jgi:Flp pilus assembly protein TadG
MVYADYTILLNDIARFIKFRALPRPTMTSLRPAFAFKSALVRLWQDRSANVALTFSLALVPVACLVGAALDYGNGALVRAQLQSAADSASLAAISQSSPGYNAAMNMTNDGAVPAGVSDAQNVFNGAMSGKTGFTGLQMTATVTKSGSTLNSSLQFSASVPTFFGGMMGRRSTSVSGTSTSSSSMPIYINYYLMLDVSGSMSFPSTASEQTRLQNINPDNYTLYPNGCTFACHFTTQGACANNEQKYNTNGYCEGFNLTRTAGNSANTPVASCPTAGTSACIQLRADAVGYAVNALLQTAVSSEKVTHQFKVGLYPFIQYLYSYFPLTANLSGSVTSSGTINYAATQLATLLDTGNNAALGSGGTHFENAFPSMNNIITSVGTGTKHSPLPYVFLITDGAQDSQTQWSGNWAGSNQATALDPSLCSPLKSRGITIAVLYVPYQPIQNPTSFANGEDFAVNAAIPNIPAALQACASPGFYYTASSPTAITAALNAMFAKSLQTAHITN